MKFPTERGIATVRGDQMSSRVCYLNSLRKSEPRTINVILAEVPAEAGTDVEMLDAPEQGKMRELCDELGIKKDFSTPHHPQANGQVEAVNKTIKHTLKRKLDASKGAWVDELPHVLWAIRMTCRTAMGETPFSMTYGA
ncbi:uncharacterized protein LOC111389189 [Olea europaea var. sylvestris]|uniref:uncharacterized protein LOC111389189 n=1 Tax=Olea europaea var. sylvestris TaxID=158386 RepID=UPI000C1D1767|nr:uncharacterized protein LOC111389189 [Olea europaea var. sylvestris]